MASVTMNPLFTAARGRVGNIVFYTVEGTVYARKYVKPRDPKTDAQKKNRALFRQAMRSWQGLSASARARYNDRARGTRMTGHNLYISRYMASATADAAPAAIKPACASPSLYHAGHFVTASKTAVNPARRASARDFTRPGTINGCFSRFHPQTG